MPVHGDHRDTTVFPLSYGACGGAEGKPSFSKNYYVATKRGKETGSLLAITAAIECSGTRPSACCCLGGRERTEQPPQPPRPLSARHPWGWGGHPTPGRCSHVPLLPPSLGGGGNASQLGTAPAALSPPSLRVGETPHPGGALTLQPWWGIAHTLKYHSPPQILEGGNPPSLGCPSLPLTPPPQEKGCIPSLRCPYPP